MKKIVQMRMGSIGLNGTFKKKGKGRDMLQVFSNCGHSLVLERGPERHCFSLSKGVVGQLTWQFWDPDSYSLEALPRKTRNKRVSIFHRIY